MTAWDELSFAERAERLKKPRRGAWKDAKDERKAKLKKHERTEMEAAKARDRAATRGKSCRWPKCKCRGRRPLHACHWKQSHRGIGGNPSGDRTRRKFIVGLCGYNHERYDKLAEIDFEFLTDDGFDGILAFYERDEAGKWQHVATERAVGVTEKTVKR